MLAFGGGRFSRKPLSQPSSSLSIVVAAIVPRLMETRQMPDIFQAGDTVPASGVYKVVHENMHIPPHYVIAIYGHTFPR